MHTILGIIMIGLFSPLLFGLIAICQDTEFWAGLIVGLILDLFVGLLIGGIYLLVN